MVMDDHEAVAAFDVAHPFLQAPIYRLNALALSRLLPEGGSLLDLGSGSGRLLVDLARARPDVHIQGQDLAANMLSAAEQTLAREGLSDRVAIRHGDMTDLVTTPARIDVVACVWALHHLPRRDDALRCLREIARLREEHDAGVSIFDFARLRRPQTFRAVMDLAPGVPSRLLEDGIASEAAAWTASELYEMLSEAGLGDLEGGAERRIGHLQAWTTPLRAANPAHDRHWNPRPLDSEPAENLLRGIISALPALCATTRVPAPL